ncbi:hypothetical protein VB620_07090 [Nodularia harveyana UHCC-0300]|uniref:Uncharacterized protein n=1 Tax=Nodularia harveyana UHCC-0300 TaxID=2974287 RepID=A0ABU5UCP5_9CYAN|nr:hypothetical protein [Nodularia harveyana]MEA5581103.1 hypothetical protein [Nodularia harveyana UHCC-0300]
MDADKKAVVSPVNVRSHAEAELELKLRELKFRQELRKDWILFIVRDVVIFSVAIAFVFSICGYSLFILINK